MKHILFKAASRGYADHGWLHAHHSFSFADYYNPERIHFGALRVLNDDSIAGGKGFGTHPHDNMEIITIPLEGALEHKDSMGNTGVIHANEIQVMSAGKGIYHSEFNHHKDEVCRLFQIWVFPDAKNVEPRYDQISYDLEKNINEWLQVVSPDPDDAGSWIHQQAWFQLTKLQQGKSLPYSIKKEGNGIYLMLIEGSIEIAGQTLERRDAIGIENLNSIEISAIKDAIVLLMDLPMHSLRP